MSLSSTQADIETALRNSGRFNQVAIWAGDVQALIDAPKQIPAAFVIMSGLDYEEPQTMGAAAALQDTLWSVVVFEYITKQPSGSEIAVYQAIEATVAAIINLPVANRRLWPFKARLLGSVKNSVAAYGVQFTLL